MDIDLNAEQAALQRSAREFLTARVPTSVVRAMEDHPTGYDATLWKEMAALGWQGVILPEEYGGSNLSFVELAILVEEIGRAICPAPLIPTFVAAVALLRGGDVAQRRRWLPSIASGEAIWTPAFVESTGSWEPGDLAVELTDVNGALQLNGEKYFVQDAHIADWMLVFAVEGDRIVAAAVPREGECVTLEPLRTIGSDRQFVVRFDAVEVPSECVLRGDGSAGWVESVTQQAAVLESAYLVGLARRDLELAVEHVTNRVQFGQPIGAFQAVQHQCANMLSDVDGAWLVTYRAAWAIANDQPGQSMSAAIAKAWTSEASSRVVCTCQHLSGAMGFTRDYDSQLYFRRQKRAELFWGDTDYHREKVVSLLEAE